MNDSIKELAKSAGLNFDGWGYPIWGSLDGEDGKKEFLEKFAELIIAGCISAALDERVVDAQIDAERDPLFKSYLKGNNCGIIDAITAIKLHFDVK